MTELITEADIAEEEEIEGAYCTFQTFGGSYIDPPEWCGAEAEHFDQTSGEWFCDKHIVAMQEPDFDTWGLDR